MKKLHCIGDQKGRLYYGKDYDTLTAFVDKNKSITSAKYEGHIQVKDELEQIQDGIYRPISNN